MTKHGNQPDRPPSPYAPTPSRSIPTTGPGPCPRATSHLPEPGAARATARLEHSLDIAHASAAAMLLCEQDATRPPGPRLGKEGVENADQGQAGLRGYRWVVACDESTVDGRA